MHLSSELLYHYVICVNRLFFSLTFLITCKGRIVTVNQRLNSSMFSFQFSKNQFTDFRNKETKTSTTHC